MSKKSKPLFDTNWKSRALAAETLYEDLRRKYDAKTIEVTIVDPKGTSTSRIPNTDAIQIVIIVHNVNITSPRDVSLDVRTEVWS